jgi:catechol 2,3-dioxygenase-like lactoylglutathione lyase family enzyme
MISGAHAMIFTEDEAADRAFLRDVLEIPCIDSGGGWLIFALPPTELGVHSGDNGVHRIYFICDDADAFVARMAEMGVEADPIAQQDWGRSTGVTLPGGGKLGIYQATHARP